MIAIRENWRRWTIRFLGDPRPPILTVQLFLELLTGLLDLSSTRCGDDWTTPIPQKSWSVRDVALRLLGGDIGVLSYQRDGDVRSAPKSADYGELVEFVRAQHDTWIRAAQRGGSRCRECEEARCRGGDAARDCVATSSTTAPPCGLGTSRSQRM